MILHQRIRGGKQTREKTVPLTNKEKQIESPVKSSLTACQNCCPRKPWTSGGGTKKPLYPFIASGSMHWCSGFGKQFPHCQRLTVACKTLHAQVLILEKWTLVHTESVCESSQQLYSQLQSVGNTPLSFSKWLN